MALAKFKKSTAVVAYSGGLDTSVILHWVKKHYHCKVIACCVDVGQAEELAGLAEKAKQSGADQVYILDARREFVTSYLWKALKASALYEGKYLLATALSRPIIAAKVVEIARKEKANILVHGATGKGNDQVRFELVFQSLYPEAMIVAPWREWKLASRAEEIAYARKYGIPVPVSKEKPYSSDRNLGHISYEGGILEDLKSSPPEPMFKLTRSPETAPAKSTILTLRFQSGEPVAIDGKFLPAEELLGRLNHLAGQAGIGRVDIVENRLVGMKSRGVYESPGLTVLHFAHRELEYLTLDRETFHLQQQLALRYAELVYYGWWFSPLREALDAFFTSTQRVVTGQVKLRLFKGNILVEQRESPFSLYSSQLATFEKDTVYNQKDAEGFINLFGLPLKTISLQQHRLGKKATTDKNSRS